MARRSLMTLTWRALRSRNRYSIQRDKKSRARKLRFSFFFFTRIPLEPLPVIVKMSSRREATREPNALRPLLRKLKKMTESEREREIEEDRRPPVGSFAIENATRARDPELTVGRRADSCRRRSSIEARTGRMVARGPVLARNPVPINALANFIRVRSLPLYLGRGFGP